MAEPFIDFMAFARGAEFANAANWRDVQNDINARTGEARLAQDEATFGLKFPLAQLGAELETERGRAAIEDYKANRGFAKFEADVSRELMGLTPDQRGAVVAQRLAEAAQTATPATMGNLARWAQAQALRELRSGNTQAGYAILRAMPDGDMSEPARQLALWNDPNSYRNPDVIRSGGGEPQPDGTVLYAGVPMLPEQFAQVKRLQATQGSLANVGQVLAPLAAHQQQLDQRAAYNRDMAAIQEANGMRAVIDPATGQAVYVPIPQVQPTYHETAGVRYPRPVTAPQTVAPSVAPVTAPQTVAPSVAPSVAPAAAPAAAPAQPAPLPVFNPSQPLLNLAPGTPLFNIPPGAPLSRWLTGAR
jgi:hypothetical protein